MKADLTRDPVFQLNILLWMSKEQPADGYYVRPLFHEHGYQILFIEYPFPLPDPILSLIVQTGVDASAAPEPEMILGRESDRSALYFEAKSESFSHTSSTARQARGHLLATGSAFEEVMSPLRRCTLCVVVPNDRRRLMKNCLRKLADQLVAFRFKPGPFSVHGLSHKKNAIYYSWDACFAKEIHTTKSSLPIIEGLREGTDPSPLFLVYTTDDYPDRERQNLARRALINQVHAEFLCTVHKLPANQVLTVSAEDILMKTTDRLFQYMGPQKRKAMRRFVNENFLSRIHEYWSERNPGTSSFANGILTVDLKTGGEAFLDWLEDLKKTQFRDNPPSEEGRLFPEPSV